MLTQFLSNFLFIVFFISGVSKLLSIRSFQVTINQFGMLRRSTRLISWAVPMLEILISFMFLGKHAIATLGAVLALVLMLAFSTITFIALKRKIDSSCNCFGKLMNSKFGLGTVLHIIVLSLAACYVLIYPKTIEFSLKETISSMLISVGIVVMYSLILEFKDASRMN